MVTVGHSGRPRNALNSNGPAITAARNGADDSVDVGIDWLDSNFGVG